MKNINNDNDKAIEMGPFLIQIVTALDKQHQQRHQQQQQQQQQQHQQGLRRYRNDDDLESE